MKQYESFYDRYEDAGASLTKADLMELYTTWIQDTHPELIGVHETIFNYAWDHGHAFGGHDVALSLDSLMNIVTALVQHLTN